MAASREEIRRLAEAWAQSQGPATQGAMAPAQTERTALVQQVADQFNRSQAAAQGSMVFDPQYQDNRLTHSQEFSHGFGRGVDQLQMSMYALAQMLGRESGFTALENYGYRGVEGNLEEIMAQPISVEGFTDIESFDDFTRWVASGLGNALPSMGSVVAGGVAGGAIGSAIGQRVIASNIYHTLRDRMVRQMVKKGVLDEDAAIKAAHRALMSPSGFRMIKDGMKGGWETGLMTTPGFARGSAAGAYATSSVMQMGEAELNLAQEGIRAPMTAVLTGLAGGALEAMPAVFVINRLFPGQQADDVVGFIKDFGKVSNTSVGQRIAASGTVQGMLMEGSTEAGQEFLQLAAVAYHDPTFDLISPESGEQIVNSFAQGALAGAFFGGATDVVNLTRKSGRDTRRSDLKRKDRARFAPFAFGDLVGKGDKTGWPEGFTPADNTVFEEVRSRVNGAVSGVLEPALNTLQTQFDSVSQAIDEVMPGLNKQADKFTSMVRNAHEEFLAGHQPIIDDAKRYAKDQVAWIYDTAKDIADPAKREEWIASQIQELTAEVQETAAFLRERAEKLAQSIGKKIDGQTLGSTAMAEELERLFPNLDLSSPEADMLRGQMTILESDPEFVFGKEEYFTDTNGTRRKRRTRGENANGFANKRSAENAIARISKKYPSASESSFEAFEADGKWYVRVVDQGQREALIEDEIVLESLEGARSVARRHNAQENKKFARRQVRLTKSKSTIDVPTLTYMSRRIGDTFTLRQGFESISGMLLERNMITNADYNRMQAAFRAYFPEKAQFMTFEEARKLDQEAGRYEGAEYTEVKEVMRELKKDAARTRFDRADITEEMGAEFDIEAMEEDRRVAQEENEARDMKKRGQPRKRQQVTKKTPVHKQTEARRKLQKAEEELTDLHKFIDEINAKMNQVEEGSKEQQNLQSHLKWAEGTVPQAERAVEVAQKAFDAIKVGETIKETRSPKPLSPKQKYNKAIDEKHQAVLTGLKRLKVARIRLEHAAKKDKQAWEDKIVELENQLEADRWSLSNLRRSKARAKFAPEAYVLEPPRRIPSTEEKFNSIAKTAFVLNGMNEDAVGPVQEIVNKVAQLLPGNTKIRVLTPEVALKMINDKHPVSGFMDKYAIAAMEKSKTDRHQVIAFKNPEKDSKTGTVMYVVTGYMNQDPAAGLWGLMHELGHAVHFDTWEHLSADQQNKLWKAFVKDARSGRTTGAILPQDYPNADAVYAKENIFEFREWMADQFVNWMADRKQPRNALERFLEAVAVKIDQLWEFMKKNESRFGKLNQTYGQFMDAVAKNIREEDATALDQFFLNDAATGRTVHVLLGANGDTLGTADLTRYDHLQIAGRKEWAALKKRVNDYPDLIRNTKNLVNFVKSAYRVALAPSVSNMREIGKRIPVANELVSIFNRDVGVSKKRRNYHDRIELMKGRFMDRFDDAVKGLSTAQKEALYEELRRIDGIENADTSQLSPAAKKIRALFDEVWDYARDAGLPVGKIPNYLPRMFDRNMMVREEDRVIQYLAGKMQGTRAKRMAKAKALFMTLTSRQAEEAGALAELRQDPLAMQAPALGAMKSRTQENAAFFRQFYLTNIDAIMSNYVVAMVKRGEYNRFFGEKADEWLIGGDEIPNKDWDGKKKLRMMLREAREQGATQEDLQFMKDFIDANTGMYGRDSVPDKWRSAMAAMIAYQNMRVLLFTVFASLPDLVGPAIRTGQSARSYKTMMSELRKIANNDEKYAQMARAWGQISSVANQHVLTEYVDNHYMPTFARKLNNAFFQYTGLNAFTDFTRKAALAVGVDYIKQQYEIANDNTKGEYDQRIARRRLKELGLNLDDVTKWVGNGEAIWGSPGYSRKGAIEKADMMVAEGLVQFVNESILKPNASQRPLLASHPAAMLAYHLKGFMYAIHDIVIRRMAMNINSAMKTTEGKMERTLQIGMLASPAIMMMALTALGLELRELITRDDRTSKMDGWEYTWELFERSGLMGAMQLATGLDAGSARGASELAALSGPTVSHVGELLSRPASQTIPKSIPVVSQLPWMRDYLRGD